MGCSSCGKKTVRIEGVQANTMGDENLLLVEYTGSQLGSRREVSKSHPTTRYIYSASHPEFTIYKEDRAQFEGRRDFRIIEDSAPMVADSEPLKAQDAPPPTRRVEETVKVDARRLEDTDLDPEIVTILADNGVETVDHAQQLSDGLLLSFSGIGPARLAKIREL